MIVCPHCNTINKDGVAFCVQCGKKVVMPTAQNTCAACGAALKAGAKFCVECGAPQAGNVQPESPTKTSPDSDATIIIPRKAKPSQASQADIETVMVIEDHPSHKPAPGKDSEQTVIIAKPRASQDKPRETHPERPAAGAQPPSPQVRKGSSASGQTSSSGTNKTPTKSGAPAAGSNNTVKAIGIGVIAALVIGGGGIYLFRNKQQAPASTPPATEASAPQVATPSMGNSAPLPTAAPADTANSQPVSTLPATVAPPPPSASVTEVPAATPTQPAPPTATETAKAPTSEPTAGIDNTTEAKPAHKASKSETREQKRSAMQRKQAEESLKRLLDQH